MSGEVATGLFTLGGTLVGGGASWWATRTQVQAQAQEAARARLDKLTEARRGLYSTLVERSDVFVDAAREVLSENDANHVPADDVDAYLHAWDQFVQGRASVEIIGPPAAATVAGELYQSIADIGNLVDGWLFQGQEWTDAEERERERLFTERTAKRSRFVEVAQKVVADGSTT